MHYIVEGTALIIPAALAFVDRLPHLLMLMHIVILLFMVLTPTKIVAFVLSNKYQKEILIGFMSKVKSFQSEF